MNVNKDLFIGIICAFLGTLFGLVVSNYKNFSPTQWAIAIFLILMMIFVLSLIGPLGLILRSSGKYRICGEWQSEWSYSKEEQTVKISDTLIIHQYGRYLKGIGKSHRIEGPFPFKGTNYKLTATVFPDGLIEGWWININDGRNYRGPFQGKINNSCSHVTIRWIGIGTNEIHSGIWYWKRTPTEA